ncbi:MAG: UbiA family prenyltransferase [Hyphomonadaceae bacterium]
MIRADGLPAPGVQTNDNDIVTMPLAVDLDGTLLLTDTLFESLAEHLRHRPLWALWQLLQLPFAIAKVKERLTKNVELDVDTLPVNQDVLAYCERAKASGREVWLVSAADQKMVDRVAARFGIFDRAIGSDGQTNNKGSAKARLLAREAPGGFEYVGDSPADYKVWKSAARSSHVGKGEARRRSIEKMGVPVAHSFELPKAGFRVWLKALRIHQWAKNALIFFPAILAMRIVEPEILLKLVFALPLLGLMTSGTYILNDLLDLQAERTHRSKFKRPFASGRIKLWHGFVAAPALILVGLVGGFIISPGFALTQLLYLAVTLSYSLVLKRAALADTMALSFLYTLRLIMGAVLASVALTQWLLVFSMFLFVSLSLAKRHVEVLAKAQSGGRFVANRGYRAEDVVLTLGLGLATATAAPLILVLYIIESAWPSGLYQLPEALWAAPVLLSLWLMRVWLLANRGELHDDPVVFAMKDRQSLIAGIALALAFIIAALVSPDWFANLAPEALSGRR